MGTGKHFFRTTFPSLEVPATWPVAMVTMSGCTLRLRGEEGNQDSIITLRSMKTAIQEIRVHIALKTK